MDYLQLIQLLQQTNQGAASQGSTVHSPPDPGATPTPGMGPWGGASARGNLQRWVDSQRPATTPIAQALAGKGREHGAQARDVDRGIGGLQKAADVGSQALAAAGPSLTAGPAAGQAAGQAVAAGVPGIIGQAAAPAVQAGVGAGVTAAGAQAASAAPGIGGIIAALATIYGTSQAAKVQKRGGEPNTGKQIAKGYIETQKQSNPIVRGYTELGKAAGL